VSALRTHASVVAAISALVLLATPPAARARNEPDWEEFSQFEFRVNIFQKTDVELQNVRETTHSNSVLMQAADMYAPPGRWVGSISMENVHRSYFRIGRRDAAKSDKGLRKWVAEVFENTAPSIKNSRVLRPRDGVGRIVYASLDGQDCVFGAGAYGLDVSFSGLDEYYDTHVHIVYCGHPEDFGQIVEFLEDVALASQSDNHAAYAARSGARSRITKRAPDGDGETARSGAMSCSREAASWSVALAKS